MSKKYFYALRPLLAAIWIEQKHQIPPVLFDDLMKMDMEPELRAAIEDLLERKKVTTEGEFNPQLPVIQAFIQDELQRQKTISKALPDDRNTDWSELNHCFIRIIGKMPITFDADCPETNPERAVRFKRVNPRRTTTGAPA